MCCRSLAGCRFTRSCWLATVLPYWAGLWFGVYATWERMLLQFAAVALTIGSYFLAKRLHKRQNEPRPITLRAQARGLTDKS